MEYEKILRSYSHLTNDELRLEIKLRSAHRYNTRMVGAEGCMVDAYVLRACRELLDRRGKLKEQEVK